MACVVCGKESVMKFGVKVVPHMMRVGLCEDHSRPITRKDYKLIRFKVGVFRKRFRKGYSGMSNHLV